jgi:hypothetical protein
MLLMILASFGFLHWMVVDDIVVGSKNRVQLELEMY